VAEIQAMHSAARAVREDILVTCYGGPISEPDDAQYVMSRTRGIAGFFGAGSMERLPTEAAITDQVRSFKDINISTDWEDSMPAVKHVVLFKFKPGTTEDQIRSSFDLPRAEHERVKSQIFPLLDSAIAFDFEVSARPLASG
jgi:hypothetical protein